MCMCMEEHVKSQRGYPYSVKGKNCLIEKLDIHLWWETVRYKRVFKFFLVTGGKLLMSHSLSKVKHFPY